MRRIQRLPLPTLTQEFLNRRQVEADKQRLSDNWDVESAWKSARQIQDFETVLEKLREMAGRRERCMYCGDSHGTDVEHFWPKNKFADRMFRWPNLLLSCAECNRFKSNKFPLADDGAPLLIDPSSEDPWDFLEFDPTTGNLVSRYIAATDSIDARGKATVSALHLDGREALAEGYKDLYQEFVRAVHAALLETDIDTKNLIARIKKADYCGLASWCFHRSGQYDVPFSSLREQHPETWRACQRAFS